MRITPNLRSLPNSGLAEPKEVSPKLALLDDFDGDPKGFPHGQAVESVLLSHSDLTGADVQRYQNTPPQADLTKLIREQGLDFRTAFGAMVSRNLAHFYLGTAVNLHGILKEQPHIKVINQSQGETPGRHLEMLYNGLQGNQQFREGACHSFGLPAEATLAEICDAMLKEADRISAESEIVAKARKEFEKASKAVYDKGITYIVASGNHGDMGSVLNSLGVEASPTAFRNILVNDYVTVVGATTPEGEPSSLNSPLASIEVLRRGEELPWQAEEGFHQSGVASGSSFAAPLAASEALEFLEANPQAGPFQVEAHLKGLDSYRVENGQEAPTRNGERLVGDGILESYIQDQLGAGFITDVSSPDARQLAQAKQERTLFGLPGEVDHEFQIVKVRPGPEGQRELSIETYFEEGHHVLRAVEKSGQWDPKSVVEELHLDQAREQQIKDSADAPKTA